MLVKGESDFECWQSEAFINEETVAERAYDDSMRLIRDGEEITLKKWAYEIINEMYGMCEVLGFDEFDTLKLMHDRVLNPDLTYGKRLLEIIRKEGYINAHMNLAINNKNTSISTIKKLEESGSPEFKKYFSLALKDE
jgi:glutamate--cysteine ligase